MLQLVWSIIIGSPFHPAGIIFSILGSFLVLFLWSGCIFTFLLDRETG